MQEYHSVSRIEPEENIQILPVNSLLLLDIETTGLTPDTAAVFMIGCGYYDDTRFHIAQWLADSLELSGEQEVLKAFDIWFNKHFDADQKIKVLTYNGQVFDLPFLESRYAQCGLRYPLNKRNILQKDLYREFLALKKLWPVKNMKLKTLSQWLNYPCTKTPEGRQLIKIYHDYIKTKDPVLLNLLFLHNITDLESLQTITQMYRYTDFFNDGYSIDGITHVSDSGLRMLLKPSESLPAPLHYENYSFQLDMTSQNAELFIPLHERGMKYYYTDYKNYVYLPDEDYALHRSMSKYIDRSHWQKASMETCYTWFSPDDHFMSDRSQQQEYVRMIFRLFGFL